MTKIIKLLILVLFLAIFGKYIYQYLKRNGQNLFSFTEKAGSFIKRNVIKSVDAVGIGDTVKKVEAKLSPSPTPAPPAPERTSTLAETVNVPRPRAKATQPAVPDSYTGSVIQKPPQKGYCYVGTDRGYRSCIAVKDKESCMSGKVFSMKEVCENPELRAGMPRNSGWYYYKNGGYQLYNPEPYFNDYYYQPSVQSGSERSSRDGAARDQFDFTRYYDMRGIGDKNYNRGEPNTTSMSQYIAQQDRNVIYGGRGESMPTYNRQRSSSPILYKS